MSNDMIQNTELKGEGQPAKGYVGRVLSVDDRALKAMPEKQINDLQKKWEDAGSNARHIPSWMGGQIGAVKKSIPEFNDAGGTQIAKAIAYDYNTLGKVAKASKEGTFLEYEGANNTRERGIVANKDDKLVRDGQWVALDKEDRIRQIATFKEGVPHGAVINYRENGVKESSAYYKEGVQTGMAYQYNEQGKVIHRTKYDDKGNIESQEAVDPVVAAAQKQERQSAIRAVNSIKIGR